MKKQKTASGHVLEENLIKKQQTEQNVFNKRRAGEFETSHEKNSRTFSASCSRCKEKFSYESGLIETVQIALLPCDDSETRD